MRKRYENITIVDRENGGLSAARNSGLDVASGKYIYFLDSDDYLLPGTLKTAMQFAMENQTDIACFNAKTEGLSLLYERMKLTGIHRH
jgi:glycosyltransferase involved in cell wall biosynthesis